MRRVRTTRRGTQEDQAGFTLLELLVATVIILVGLVAVAQLVPTSVLMNSNNRSDGTALVFAQHELEAMRTVPLNQATFSDPQGVLCPLGNTCQLGDPTQPGQLVGSPVNTGSGTPIIDFSAPPLNDGYNFTYIDPNDPYGAAYDVRWAVVSLTNGGATAGRRIILGVFRRGMKSTALPVTLDTMVSR